MTRTIRPRMSRRIPANLSVVLQVGTREVPAHLREVSAGGFLLECMQELPETFTVLLASPSGTDDTVVPVRIQHASTTTNGDGLTVYRLGLAITDRSPAVRSALDAVLQREKYAHFRGRK